jgi:hypothetical protein
MIHYIGFNWVVAGWLNFLLYRAAIEIHKSSMSQSYSTVANKRVNIFSFSHCYFLEEEFNLVDIFAIPRVCQLFLGGGEWEGGTFLESATSRD